MIVCQRGREDGNLSELGGQLPHCRIGRTVVPPTVVPRSPALQAPQLDRNLEKSPRPASGLQPSRDLGHAIRSMLYEAAKGGVPNIDVVVTFSNALDQSISIGPIPIVLEEVPQVILVPGAPRRRECPRQLLTRGGRAYALYWSP